MSSQLGPDLVRAARLHRHGAPLRVEPVELPDAGETEIRVELKFGGVNPIDRYTAEGRVSADGPLPRTLGAEAAGTADGQLVLISGEGLGGIRDGVWAQAAVVPRASVIVVPADVALREAAAMGIAGLTALNAVRELARVSAEDRVLVLGASGGVGSMIVSLCAALGATVWGHTGAQDKAGPIAEQGAGRVLVTGPESLAEQISEFEPTVVFDPLGGDYVAPVVQALAPRGRLVSFGVSAGAEVSFNMQLVYRKMISLLGYGAGQLTRAERRSGLQDSLEALRDGRLRVRIDEVMALEAVNDAFARLSARAVQGKLLLDLA